MKKEEIYVKIDSEEKRLRAVDVLKKAGEEIFEDSGILEVFSTGNLYFSKDAHTWCYVYGILDEKEITLDQLEALLMPKYHVKTDNSVTLDYLKKLADSLGYQLVEKPYEPKVGDFGVFKKSYCDFEYIEFLDDISDEKFYMKNNIPWDSFRKLTDEEKTKIQEAW
jgi:hypothetical protein